MTHADLQDLQSRLNFDGPSMAVLLGIDTEQFRRYRYGKTPIPANVDRAAHELEGIENMRRELMCKRLDAVPLGMTRSDYCG